MSMSCFCVFQKLIFGIEVNACCTSFHLTYPINHFCGKFVLLINIGLTVGEHISNLPIQEVLSIVLQMTVRRVFEAEQNYIQNLFNNVIEQLSSPSVGLNQQMWDVINSILKSSDKWTYFEKIKHGLNNNIQQILGPSIERERQFISNVEKIKNSAQAMDGFRQALGDLQITFATVTKRRADVQRMIINLETVGGSLLKQAIEDFF